METRTEQLGPDSSFPTGEHALKFDSCVPAGVTIAIRIRWYNTRPFYWPYNVILRIRGFEEGDAHGSRFDGQTGYIDCDGKKHVLAPVPWQELGMAPKEGRAGAVVINPLVELVDADSRSMTTLKTRSQCPTGGAGPSPPDTSADRPGHEAPRGTP